jgi:transcriptional regulator with XRE-family HTH domain
MVEELGLQRAPNLQKSKQSVSERKAKADRLARVFAREKVRNGWTQTTLAKKLGITQGTLGGYLNGRYTVSTDFLVQFADALNVPLEDLEPNVCKSLKKTVLRGRTKAKVPVLFSLSGKLPVTRRNFAVTAVKQVDVGEMLFGIDVDVKAYEPTIMKGSTLILSPLAELKKGDLIATRRLGDESFNIARIHSKESEDTMLINYCDSRSSNAPELMSMGDFSMCEKIITVELP